MGVFFFLYLFHTRACGWLYAQTQLRHPIVYCDNFLYSLVCCKKKNRFCPAKKFGFWPKCLDQLGYFLSVAIDVVVPPLYFFPWLRSYESQTYIPYSRSPLFSFYPLLSLRLALVYSRIPYGSTPVWWAITCVPTEPCLVKAWLD